MGIVMNREDLPDYGRQAARHYREVRDDDALVGGIFYALESLFRRVEFIEMPAEKPDGPRGQWTEKRADQWAAFLKGCRDDMSHTWAAFISEILTELTYGFAPFEVCYKLRLGPEQRDSAKRSRYSDGRVGWRKIPLREQTSVSRWETDTDGGIVGFYQYTQAAAEVLIPMSKALLFRTTEANNNPEGRSLLRNARRSYYFQKRLEEIEAIGIERDLAGLPMMQVPVELLGPPDSLTPEQAATLAGLQQQMAGVRNDERAYLITPAEEYVAEVFDATSGTKKPVRLPTGYKFSLVSSGGSRAHDTNQVIKRYTSRIATSLLSTFLLLGGDGKGAMALSKDLTQLFELAGTGVLDGVIETFNRFAVQPLMQLNGVPSELWPTLTHGGLSAEALKDLIGTVNTLLASGGLLRDDNLEDFLRAALKLPDRSPDAPAEPPVSEQQKPAVPPEDQAPSGEPPPKE